MKKIRKFGLFAVGSIVASIFLLLSVMPAYAKGPQSAAGEMVQYPSGDATINAFIARPAGSGKHAAVIVVHDDTGLNDAMKDAARALAAAGFVAIAPDLTSRAGAAPARGGQGGGGDEEGMGGGGAGGGAAAKLRRVSPDDTIADVKAAFAYLQKDSGVDGAKISAIGFGWGGWRVFKVAEDTPLHRAVVFYGTTPILDDDLTKIKVPIQAHYAQYDFQVTGNSIWTEKMLGKSFSDYIYPDTSRGFYVGNGSQPGSAAKGNADASKQAWTRTVDFLKG